MLAPQRNRSDAEMGTAGSEGRSLSESTEWMRSDAIADSDEFRALLNGIILFWRSVAFLMRSVSLSGVALICWTTLAPPEDLHNVPEDVQKMYRKIYYFAELPGKLNFKLAFTFENEGALHPKSRIHEPRT